MTFKLISIESIEKIIGGFRDAVKRFPMAMTASLAGTVVGIVLINIDEQSFYPNLLMTIILGIPLFVAIVLLGEQRMWTFMQKIIANATAIIFLVAYYFLLPNNIFYAQDFFIVRHIMWEIGFLLLITFSPFLKKRGEEMVIGFWHYNRVLFFSLALTALWAGAIQAGLSVAMASVDYLFEIDIDSERYMELWAVIVGIFATSFFLSRVPKDIQIFQKEESYPKELRLFSQYVLVPLVSIYFLILYAYVVRVLVTQVWPKGVLAYMILGFSFVGVLTYISLYPLRKIVDWVRKAGTVFYIVIIPQIGMLFWALWFRISEYGITENRYFVFVFGWWLLAIALYFLISKNKDIRIIPITIFAISLISSFGPWGAFAVSERSQINRLEKLLIKNEILINSKVERVDEGEESVPFEDRKEISAVLAYLNNVHGMDGIQKWFDKDFSDLEVKDENAKGLDSQRDYLLPQKIVEQLLGINYVEMWEGVNKEDDSFYFSADYQEENNLIDISQYDYMSQINGLNGEIGGIRLVGSAEIVGESVFRKIGDIDGIEYRLNVEGEKLFILEGAITIAEIDLHNFIEELMATGDQYNLDKNRMMVEFENEHIALAIYFTSINGKIKDADKYEIDFVTAMLLFSLFKP